MFGRTLFVALICLAPYAHMIATWASGANISGNFLLWSLILVFASPAVLAVIAFSAARSGFAMLRSGITERNPLAAAVGGTIAYKLAGIMVTGVLTALWIGWVFLAPPEPGRDRLGRICEKTDTGSTVCRPDPAANRPTELERANRRFQWERKFKLD